MLNKIIEFSIKNKLIIGLFLIALIGFGSYSVSQLPIDAVPDITNNQVQIITIAPSFGANDIERLVTFPIEQACSNIPGTLEMRSFSRFGLSLVTIVFKDEIDIYLARQQVSERLQKVQAEIPPGIGKPELGPISSGLGEIYQYVVRSKKGYESKYTETELRTIQDWVVRRQLLGVKGVAEISGFGGKLKQYEVAVNPNKLQAFNITINDVFSAIENNNQNTGGTYIEKGPTVLYIRSEGLIGNLDDIKNISIKNTESGIPLFIRDVADVKLGYATRYGALTYNDKGEVAGGIVMMLKGANSSEVIKNVKERIEQIQKTLPEGVVLEPFLDRTKMVNNAIGTVSKNLMEGALIVIFVLVLFLGNFRAGLLVASVIPLAMLFAIILMNAFGVSGNLMSLGALDFGLIVDGAVIIVEAVMHQLAHNKKFKNIQQLNQLQMDGEVNYSSSKMMNSAVFGQIIILVVYLPIFSLQGIEGKMFKPMAQTVAFALLGAFVLSLTYIPMMSALFLSKKTKHNLNISDKIMAILEIGYQKTLSRLLRHSKKVLTTVILLFILAIVTLTFLGGEFIPVLEEGDFALETRLLKGSNLTTVVQSVTQASKILKDKFPEVEKVVAKIGSGDVPTDPMPIDAADIMIILKDKSEWTSAKTFDELSEKMGTELKNVVGTTFAFSYPVQMRFNELMTGAKQDVVCKVFGEDLDSLAHYADKIGSIISKIEGTKDLYIEPVTGMPEIIINYNRAAIAQYNLNINDINKIVNTAFAGQSTGLIFEGEKRFNLVVRLDNDNRKNLEDVKNLLIPTPLGTQVPLYQLAEVSIKNGPNQIQREDAKRRIVIGFNIHGRDVQSIVKELQEKIDANINFSTGYYPTYGGTFENLNEAKQRLMIAVPVSLVLIFVLLFFAFKSIKQGLLIYSAIPLSAIGGIFFLALRGMPFSISAGIGFIALFGVAVLNGIVLIAEFNRLKNEGVSNIYKIVLQGTKMRLRPILMTAFVASLGFLPMAISNGSGAEVQRPLATVVIGGLLIATFLTLFVLPILYILIENGKWKSTIGKKQSVLIVLCFLCLNYNVNGQININLQSALDSAIKNNGSLKNEKLKSEYQRKLIKTGFNIPQTTITGGYGQINSVYKDNSIGLSQSFNFPTVYSNQKKILKEEWNNSILNVSLKESEIKKLVRQTFYNYLYLKRKETLLIKNDSLYSAFTERTNLRFKKGESNVLEKTTAETQLGNIKIQLKELQQELEIVLLEFRLIINSKALCIPFEEEVKIKSEIKNDSSLVTQHPYLKLFEQQKKISLLNTKLEKAKLFPELFAGYNNMSIQGAGNDGATYTSSTRFQAFQVGVGIPLFFGSQKAKISSSKIYQQIDENNFNLQKLKLNNTYIIIYKQYQMHLSTIEYYENIALKNATMITQTANKQYLNGDINYLEWVMLTNQTIQIKNNYLNEIKALNESVIELNYLLNK